MVAGVQVLICDDEPDIRHLYRSAFQLAGTDVTVARDADECVALAHELHPSLVILDLMMPRRDGFSALAELHETCPECHVVIVSAYATPANTTRAQGMGADACFEKLDFLARIPSLVSRYDNAA